VALRRELANVHAASVGQAIADFGWEPIAVAALFAAASFFPFGLFEVLALRDTAEYDGCEAASHVSARDAFLTSFVANALSQTIGLAVLTGSAVRLRSYARYRVTGAGVAHISAFVTITATL